MCSWSLSELKHVPKSKAAILSEFLAWQINQPPVQNYFEQFVEEEEIDLLAVRAERETLKAELAALEVEMDGYLKELGYDS